MSVPATGAALSLAAQLALAPAGPGAWRDSGVGGARGITVGPIENGYHPGVGYGSPAYERTLDEAVAMRRDLGRHHPVRPRRQTWPAGRRPHLRGPVRRQPGRILRAIAQAHARGLRVMLVPHLWVESGEWRALIDPKTDAGWTAWAASYRAFVLAWAAVAEAADADLFSAGVELRSWVTTPARRASRAIIADVRRVYHGLSRTRRTGTTSTRRVILGDLDVIGINAFYPLADHEAPRTQSCSRAAARVRDKVHALAEAWRKPVLFTEIGYTTRADPAVRPWEWPDAMKGVVRDSPRRRRPTARSSRPLLDEPDFAGFFVWRVYGDPDDVSQEAEWGFSPRGKLAELVVRDAFAARWAGDGGWLTP